MLQGVAYFIYYFFWGQLSATTTGLCNPNEITALLMCADLKLLLCMPPTLSAGVYRHLGEVLSCAHFQKKGETPPHNPNRHFLVHEDALRMDNCQP